MKPKTTSRTRRHGHPAINARKVVATLKDRLADSLFTPDAAEALIDMADYIAHQPDQESAREAADYFMRVFFPYTREYGQIHWQDPREKRRRVPVATSDGHVA